MNTYIHTYIHPRLGLAVKQSHLGDNSIEVAAMLVDVGNAHSDAHNIDEAINRTIKRQRRRLHGRGHVGRDLESMPPTMPLVLNLNHNGHGVADIVEVAGRLHGRAEGDPGVRRSGQPGQQL